jgi:hypothetical protein
MTIGAVFVFLALLFELLFASRALHEETVRPSFVPTAKPA